MAMTKEEIGEFHSSRENKSRYSISDKTIVLLSIEGNSQCKDDYLEIILNKVIKEYHSSLILIADQIHWHNLKTQVNPSLEEEQVLRLKANSMGADYINAQLGQLLSPIGMSLTQFSDQYQDKNALEKIEIINELAKEKSINYEIVVWSQWVEKTPKYKEYKKELEDLYTNIYSLKTSIEKQAQAHVKSKLKKNPHLGVDSSHLILQSVGYLTEESAALIWLAAYLDYNYITYPGEKPSPFKATQDYLIRPLSDKSMDDSPIKHLMIYKENPKKFVNWEKVSFKPNNQELKADAIEEPKPKPEAKSEVKVNRNNFFSQQERYFELAVKTIWAIEPEEKRVRSVKELIKEMSSDSDEADAVSIKIG